jgi:ribosomal protein S26
MAIRLVFIIMFALSCVFLIRKYKAMRSQKTRNITEPKILACADCGVYVPESDAVRRHGRVYCSSMHAENHEV